MNTNGRTPRPDNPPDLRNRLRALRDTNDIPRWKLVETVADMAEELGRHFNRKQAADDAGVLPSHIGQMIITKQRIGYLRDIPRFEGFTYSDWVYIARDLKPEEFADSLLESMDDYGGYAPPVRVIRARLAERNGRKRPPKRRRWALVVQSVRHTQSGRIAEMLMDGDEDDPQPGTAITGIEVPSEG